MTGLVRFARDESGAVANEIHPIALNRRESANSAKSEVMRAHWLDMERLWLQIANQNPASSSEVGREEIIVL